MGAPALQTRDPVLIDFSLFTKRTLLRSKPRHEWRNILWPAVEKEPARAVFEADALEPKLSLLIKCLQNFW